MENAGSKSETFHQARSRQARETGEVLSYKQKENINE